MSSCALRAGLSGLAAMLLVASVGSGQIVPIFDWGVRNEVKATPEIIPVPHSGHDWSADHPIYQDLYDLLSINGLPISVMLRNDTGPAAGTRDPDALSTVLDYAPYMTYVWADFEDEWREDNVLVMVDQVRNHPDPNVNQARIGNYAEHAGPYDESFPFPSQSDRSKRAAFYVASGLDVSMPNCYPYEYYETHTSSYSWGEHLAPSVRAAFFWATLERYSVAKRALPEGHMIMAWTSGFVAWTGYDADPPDAPDREALIQHIRLRGADGYYTLNSGIPGLSSEDYRREAFAAWESLDWLFAEPGARRILTLDTDKRAGVQWSGMQVGRFVVILVSNLGNTRVAIDYPAIRGLPATSPGVDIGAHATFVYDLIQQVGPN